MCRRFLCLWDILAQDRTARGRSGVLGQGIFAISRLTHGADLVLRMQGSTELPVHRVVLSAGCAALARVLGDLGSLHDRESGVSVKLLPAPSPRNGAGPPRALAETPRLAIAGVHPFRCLYWCTIYIRTHYWPSVNHVLHVPPQRRSRTGAWVRH
ncbi:hypothetical protein B0F90DRAFT_1796972, partial [Multifurca ochricompacta]